ncbi:ImuA family protein [Aurantiacibacter aquimixticola]|uniref:Protein ImuA n=1 Tax=Aurantiacibacter aquimixticola TaxID=1958945 RepID=A0A419RUQ9_9SPHN|nr:hypothetical protein [Aurantiacibacter aquimixticola]RJY09510.1 hypothetical protein D6201_09205 [Aurantiacibacter aquimixticola]
MNIQAIRSAPPYREAALCELFTSSRDAAGIGFVLARLGAAGTANKPILWAQDRMTLLELGSPSPRGLAGWGVAPDMIRVCVSRTADLLWTMEEGLKCADVSAVVGEVWGDAPALGFTATKRLMMRAEKSGIPAWLIRVNGSADLSAAGERWRVQALPSAPHPYDTRAPGDPRWSAELFRARWRKPGEWAERYNVAAHRLHLDSAPADRALAAVSSPEWKRRAAG